MGARLRIHATTVVGLALFCQIQTAAALHTPVYRLLMAKLQRLESTLIEGQQLSTDIAVAAPPEPPPPNDVAVAGPPGSPPPNDVAVAGPPGPPPPNDVAIAGPPEVSAADGDMAGLRTTVLVEKRAEHGHGGANVVVLTMVISASAVLVAAACALLVYKVFGKHTEVPIDSDGRAASPTPSDALGQPAQQPAAQRSGFRPWGFATKTYRPYDPYAPPDSYLPKMPEMPEIPEWPEMPELPRMPWDELPDPASSPQQVPILAAPQLADGYVQGAAEFGSCVVSSTPH